MDAFLFSLIDKDAKSIQSGNFECHGGLFYYDGQTKYNLNLGTTNSTNGVLVAAKGIQYMAQKWCVMLPSASLTDPQAAPSVSYACANADCMSLGYMTSCGKLTASRDITYAFNSYYQQNNQLDSACQFSEMTMQKSSTGDCPFMIVITTYCSFDSLSPSAVMGYYCRQRTAIVMAGLLSYYSVF